MKRKRLAFPNMGRGLYLAAKPFFEILGIEVVRLSKPTRRFVELGVKHAPECACFPLKVVLGDFLQAAELGADYFAIFGGSGPCRFGYYGATLDCIARRLGYKEKPKVLVVDRYREKWMREETMPALGLELKNLFRILRGAPEVFFRLALAKMIEDLSRQTRPFETKKGETEEALEKAFDLLTKENGFLGLLWLKKRIKNLFKEVELRKIDKDNPDYPVRIGVVGEIYMTLESEVNFHIERKLGQLGALVDTRALSLLDFIWSSLGIGHLRAKKAAYPYLKYTAGGESIYSIGYSVLFAKWGYDGIVHISPFGCMPEIVSQTIMNKISRIFGIPILNLVLDEHVIETGLDTRLEAFVETLKRKRGKRKRQKNKWV